MITPWQSDESASTRKHCQWPMWSRIWLSDIFPQRRMTTHSETYLSYLQLFVLFVLMTMNFKLLNFMLLCSPSSIGLQSYLAKRCLLPSKAFLLNDSSPYWDGWQMSICSAKKGRFGWECPLRVFPLSGFYCTSFLANPIWQTSESVSLASIHLSGLTPSNVKSCADILQACGSEIVSFTTILPGGSTIVWVEKSQWCITLTDPCTFWATWLRKQKSFLSTKALVWQDILWIWLWLSTRH